MIKRAASGNSSPPAHWPGPISADGARSGRENTRENTASDESIGDRSGNTVTARKSSFKRFTSRRRPRSAEGGGGGGRSRNAVTGSAFDSRQIASRPRGSRVIY